ncbi:HAD family hydrolase [Poseidonocella sedimentorum]|uniref:Putative hydrolase of the HAD superfamily n=1 Tax=Poseidonocella sedimentorum TaxID=871652 RepID=A0A1I6DU30_9RHOB|nr:HAD family hydrolase [Poseidonocella sedimentorum]SFR09000.1 putative hydrolase of the HAD superfamily [Poseidonocella sedimentorum]
MPKPLSIIAFDADDTLWHNERFFQLSQARFAELLADTAAPENLMARLEAAERRNLVVYGYGIKGFVLSMIETAVEVTEGRVSGAVISELLDLGHEMLRHPIDLLDGVEDTISTLTRSHRLLLITKGDLLDQERKLAQSGLGDHFHAIEIVSEKKPETYAEIFARHGAAAEDALMSGNSIRSDILPVVEIGGWGVHVPHELLWSLEAADAPETSPRFRRINELGALTELVRRIEAEENP